VSVIRRQFEKKLTYFQKFITNMDILIFCLSFKYMHRSKKHIIGKKSVFVKLQLSGMIRVECWMSSNLSTNITVAIFRVKCCLGYFWKPYIGHTVPYSFGYSIKYYSQFVPVPKCPLSLTGRITEPGISLPSSIIRYAQLVQTNNYLLAPIASGNPLYILSIHYG
jgi:hypothetical protein